jgi:hypothetical protein
MKPMPTLYYTTRFVDGLREDLKFVVMNQRPSTIDSTCALALVQEEAAKSSRKCEFKRFDHTSTRLF